MTNEHSTPGRNLAWPSDEAAAPKGSRSALSAPENFIAESQISSLLHRCFGRKRWPILTMGIVAIGGAAAYVGLHAPSPLPPKAVVAKDTARSTADSSVRTDTTSIGVTEATARTADAAPGPQELPNVAAEPAAPGTGANFQRRLAAAGLPNVDTSPIGTTDAPVTAFPPTAAVELEAPPAEPTSTAQPPSELLPAEKQSAAAAETPPEKASPLPNPKLDALVARAEQLLAAGEITKARQFFGRIAADGDARGALGMARSYDEQILRKLPAGGLNANPAQAKWWYDKAQDLRPDGQPDRTGSVSAAR